MRALSLRAWIAIGALAVLIILVSVVRYQNNQIGDLNKENGAAVVHVETARETVELKEKSEKIDEVAVTNVVVKEREVKQATDKRIKDTHVKVEKIEQEEAAKPSTPESVAQTDQQVSTVRITAMWDAYCSAKKGADGCPVPQPIQEKQDVHHSQEEIDDSALAA